MEAPFSLGVFIIWAYK